MISLTQTLVLCIFVSSAASRLLTGSASTPRGMITLSNVITFYTGRDSLDYNGYGCYCGLGGGGTPLDAVDRCCQIHDSCYGDTSCWITHIVWTEASCSGGRCTCLDKVGTCEHQACSCDVQFGECLRNAHYNSANKGYCPN